MASAGMSPVPDIRFLAVDGRRLAYEVAGEGPLLVCPAWWVSHLELDRGNQAFARFWEAIGVGYRVVRYDRLGVGVSDRELREEDLTLDGEVGVIGALLDEFGAERVGLLGGSSSGCAAIAFAARFPERVERLVLYFLGEASSKEQMSDSSRDPRPRRRRCARRSSRPCARIGGRSGSRGFSGIERPSA